MGIKSYKATSPGRRNMQLVDFKDLDKVEPLKSLLTPIKKTGGRNNTGRITVRHKGGGVKRAYRLIDFKREYSKINRCLINKHDSAPVFIDFEREYKDVHRFSTKLHDGTTVVINSE